LLTYIYKKSQLLQIIGLTASPGSGKAKTSQKATEHVMTLLGNLDVTTAPVQVVRNKNELTLHTKEDEFGEFCFW